MLQVDEERLAVLERVERRHLGGGVRRRRQRPAQPSRHGGGVAEGVMLLLFQHRQQRLELLADEILPQVVAGAEQQRQLLHDAGVGQQVEQAPLFRQPEDLLGELLEAQQRGIGVGRHAHEVGELLGEQHRQLDLIEQRGVGDRRAGAVHYVYDVLHPPAAGGDPHALDRHLAQRQRGAEAVQEQRRVLRDDAHAGNRAAGRGREIADVDLHRIEGGRRRPVAPDGLRHQLAHAPPRRLRRAALQVADPFQQAPFKLLAPRFQAQGARLRGDAAAAEAVDDQPAHARLRRSGARPPAADRRAMPGGGPPGELAEARPGRFRRRRRGRAVGIRRPALDGESAGAEHPGDQRKQPRVVGGKDGAMQRIRGRGNGHHRQRARGVEPAELAELDHHLRQRELRVVVVSQPRQVGVDEGSVDSLQLADEQVARRLHRYATGYRYCPPASPARRAQRAARPHPAAALRCLRCCLRCRSRGRTPTDAAAGRAPSLRSPSCTRSRSPARLR